MSHEFFLALVELVPVPRGAYGKTKGGFTNVIVPARDRDAALREIASSLPGKWEIKMEIKVLNADELEAKQALDDFLVAALKKAKEECQIQWTVLYTWSEDEESDEQ